MKALIKILAIGMLLSAVSVGVTSCGGDEPKKKPEVPVVPPEPTPPTPNPNPDPNPNPQPDPQPEPNPNAADYPAKVIVEMAEGHMHGSLFHGNPFSSEFPLRKIQRMTLVRQGDKYVHSAGEKIFNITGGSAWSVIVSIFDDKGVRLNSKYLTSEEAKLCQMFVTVSNVKDLKTSAVKNMPAAQVLAPFVYRDTDPEDKMLQRNSNDVVLTKSNVGFKGYFCDIALAAKPTKENKGGGILGEYISFDLNLWFMRFKSAEEKANGGNPYSAFDADAHKKASPVFDISVPARIITNHPWSDSDEERYVRDIAETFGMSFDQVNDAWNNLMDIDPESANYYI